jgi:hypothetical protein
MAFSSPDFDLIQIKFLSMAFSSPDFDLIQIKFLSMAFSSPDRQNTTRIHCQGVR